MWSAHIQICENTGGINQLFGHCMATWYAMSRFLVKLTEIGTNWRVWLNSDPIAGIIIIFTENEVG